MIKTFTQTDLIRYLYQEITEEEKREIEKALICDSELMALFRDLTELKESLNDAKLEPSNSTIMNILSYARSQQQKPA